MHEILREQASILRSLADELCSVADAMERESQQTIPAFRDSPPTATWPANVQPPVNQAEYTPLPSLPDDDMSPTGLTIAVPDGKVDETYTFDGASDRINWHAALQHARTSAAAGKVVKLDRGPDKDPIFLTAENAWSEPVEMPS